MEKEYNYNCPSTMKLTQWSNPPGLVLNYLFILYSNSLFMLGSINQIPGKASVVVCYYSI